MLSSLSSTIRIRFTADPAESSAGIYKIFSHCVRKGGQLCPDDIVIGPVCSELIVNSIKSRPFWSQRVNVAELPVVPATHCRSHAMLLLVLVAAIVVTAPFGRAAAQDNATEEAAHRRAMLARLP